MPKTKVPKKTLNIRGHVENPVVDETAAKNVAKLIKDNNIKFVDLKFNDSRAACV